MAKSARVLIGLACTVCKQQNYVTVKSKTNTPDPLSFAKYCKKCKKKTDHKERKKLD